MSVQSSPALVSADTPDLFNARYRPPSCSTVVPPHVLDLCASGYRLAAKICVYLGTGSRLRSQYGGKTRMGERGEGTVSGRAEMGRGRERGEGH